MLHRGTRQARNRENENWNFSRFYLLTLMGRFVFFKCDFTEGKNLGK
jgi:hypothetical protein